MFKIRIYMLSASTAVLGPYKRFGLWTQGCTKRCKGCISPDAQSLGGGEEYEISKLVDLIINEEGIEGITISGGEPFLQQEALCELIDEIRNVRDFGVIVYTGMLFSEIRNTQLARRCDLIIDGEYIEALNDDRSLRGSSNQNVICITDRYRDIVCSHYGQAGRKMELILRNGSFHLVGIPSKCVSDMLI